MPELNIDHRYDGLRHSKEQNSVAREFHSRVHTQGRSSLTEQHHIKLTVAYLYTIIPLSYKFALLGSRVFKINDVAIGRKCFFRIIHTKLYDYINVFLDGSTH
jgi:hypothetical protein